MNFKWCFDGFLIKLNKLSFIFYFNFLKSSIQSHHKLIQIVSFCHMYLKKTFLKKVLDDQINGDNTKNDWIMLFDQ